MNCKKLEFEFDYVDLELDDGQIEKYFVTALYEVDGRKYLSLVSGLEDAEGDDLESLEGHLLEYLEMDEGDFELAEIQSDDEFNRIVQMIQTFEDQLKEA